MRTVGLKVTVLTFLKNKKLNMKETAFNLINKLSETLSLFETQRDFEELNSEEQEFYDTLNFCMDLLARTKFNTETDDIPEAAGHEGEDTGFNPLPVIKDSFADAAFNIVTKQNSVDLRSILKRFMHSQKEAAQIIDKREATISEYLNKKSSFNCDSYEAIINAYIQKK